MAKVLRLARFFTGGDGLAPGVGQAANQPGGVYRVGNPGFGPAFADTGLDGLRVYGLAVTVEQGKFSARLTDTAVEP